MTALWRMIPFPTDGRNTSRSFAIGILMPSFIVKSEHPEFFAGRTKMLKVKFTGWETEYQ